MFTQPNGGIFAAVAAMRHRRAESEQRLARFTKRFRAEAIFTFSAVIARSV
jgi:hypothetical protein